MHDSTALVLRSYRDNTVMVLRTTICKSHNDSFANASEITMAALRCIQIYSESTGKALRQHSDKFVAVAPFEHTKTFCPSVTALHSHVTPPRQMQKHWACRATLLQSHCAMGRIFLKLMSQYCRCTLASPVWLGYYDGVSPPVAFYVRIER